VLEYSYGGKKMSKMSKINISNVVIGILGPLVFGAIIVFVIGFNPTGIIVGAIAFFLGAVHMLSMYPIRYKFPYTDPKYFERPAGK